MCNRNNIISIGKQKEISVKTRGCRRVWLTEHFSPLED
jgi:hypothetical protein